MYAYVIYMELKKYTAKIISKMNNVGTLSEGPDYYLRLDEPNEFDQLELFMRKEAHLWQEDPVLQEYVGKRVLLKGEPIYTKHVKLNETFKSEGIIYKEINLLD